MNTNCWKKGNAGGWGSFKEGPISDWLPSRLSPSYQSVNICRRPGGTVFQTGYVAPLRCVWSSPAFSLVEVLVVIAIMAVLMAVMVPATTSLMGGMNVGRSAGMVTDELNFARQTALSRNRDVEVRFYKLGSKLDGNDKQFRAFRSFLIDGIDPAGWKPLSRLKQLPEPIIISDSTTYSSLLDGANAGYGGLTKSSEVLPGSGSTDYISFLFRADGGTSLKPITEKWFLTVYSAKGNDGSTLPKNYFTAQVDPVTGRTRSYRP